MPGIISVHEHVCIAPSGTPAYPVDYWYKLWLGHGVTSIRMRLVCTTMYATGLRIAEACQLRPGDVDAQRRLIHVRRGKGGRDRQVPMGERLLGLLREYWRIARPEGEYLFPGDVPGRPISAKSVWLALQVANGLGQGRGRLAQQLGGAAETALLGRGDEHAEGTELVHGRFLPGKRILHEQAVLPAPHAR